MDIAKGGERMRGIGTRLQIFLLALGLTGCGDIHEYPPYTHAGVYTIPCEIYYTKADLLINGLTQALLDLNPKIVDGVLEEQAGKEVDGITYEPSGEGTMLNFEVKTQEAEDCTKMKVGGVLNGVAESLIK